MIKNNNTKEHYYNIVHFKKLYICTTRCIQIVSRDIKIYVLQSISAIKNYEYNIQVFSRSIHTPTQKMITDVTYLQL